jgi:hypothetical protein
MWVPVLCHQSWCRGCSKLAGFFKIVAYKLSLQHWMQIINDRLQVEAVCGIYNVRRSRNYYPKTTLTYVVTDCLQSSLFCNNKELLSVSRTAAEGLCVDFTQNFTNFWRPSNENAPRGYHHWLPSQLVVSRKVPTAAYKVAATMVFCFCLY